MIFQISKWDILSQRYGKQGEPVPFDAGMKLEVGAGNKKQTCAGRRKNGGW
jgi:hypothetical protein